MAAQQRFVVRIEFALALGRMMFRLNIYTMRNTHGLITLLLGVQRC